MCYLLGIRQMIRMTENGDVGMQSFQRMFGML
jgi:hypothetical protein